MDIQKRTGDRNMRILIVEDSTEQQAFARRQLATFGADLDFVDTYVDFERAIQSKPYDAVLSDLYFPSGCQSIDDAHRSEATALVQEYITKLSVTELANAAQFTFGFSAVTDLEKLVEAAKHTHFLGSGAQETDLRRSAEQLARNHKYTTFAEELQTGKHLPPSGMFAQQYAKNNNIPCVIVTSVYHHDHAFEPFRERIGPYIDTTRNGEKGWVEGYTRLQNGN